MAKGGVGKTTTAVNLAHGLAALGKRVLLVDCDTQNQVAKFLGVSPACGLYEFVTATGLKGERVFRNEILYATRQNLWVLAGGIRLVELKNWLGEQPRNQRQTVLRERLVPRQGALDFMIFDCAPGWDVLSVNILIAADEVLCPVALQGPCLEGLKTFFRYLQSAQKLNRRLRLNYVLPTMYDRRTLHGEQILAQLRKFFPRQLCDPIGYNVRLSEAAVDGRTIFEYRPSAASAADYSRLIRRILNHAKSQE
jgi:chromosome partitioning protein